MDKQLKGKAISVKGKDYVQVKDRVLYFVETYQSGSITTEILENSERVTVKATVDTGTGQKFTGHSQAMWDDKTSMVNKTSALENAETSAVGRALAFMGIGVIESIASSDEVNKALNTKPYTKPTYKRPEEQAFADSLDNIPK